MLGAIGIQHEIGRLHCIEGDFSHSRVNHLAEAEFTLSVGCIHVALELIVRNFVPLFVLTI